MEEYICKIFLNIPGIYPYFSFLSLPLSPSLSLSFNMPGSCTIILFTYTLLTDASSRLGGIQIISTNLWERLDSRVGLIHGKENVVAFGRHLCGVGMKTHVQGENNGRKGIVRPSVCSGNEDMSEGYVGMGSGQVCAVAMRI